MILSRKTAIRCFSVCYILFAILLLTLAPFKFNWVFSSNTLGWYFNLMDFAKNVLLFFPLGVVVQHAFPRRCIGVVVFGAVFSMAIEYAQLWALDRTSNYHDIIANTLGMAAGCLYYTQIFGRKGCANDDFILGLMFAPLCWFIAMRSNTHGVMAWSLIPLALAGYLAFRTSLPTNFKGKFALFVWYVVCLSPMAEPTNNRVVVTMSQFSVTTGMLVVLAVPIFAAFCKAANRDFRLVLLSLALGFILLLDSIYFKSLKFPILWTWREHLYWIDASMGIVLWLSFVLWTTPMHEGRQIEQ